MKKVVKVIIVAILNIVFLVVAGLINRVITGEFIDWSSLLIGELMILFSMVMAQIIKLDI